MQSFQLAEITTRDGLLHQGIFFKPAKASKRALLWVHGLTGTFYGNQMLLNTFADYCNKIGYGFASFNNRGHDLVSGGKRIDKRKPKGYRRIIVGGGLEKFKDSIFDIDAGVNFLVEQGFWEVIIVGQSTGANKACYYGGTSKNSHVKAIVLVSPVSDRYDPALTQSTLQKNLETMQKLIAEGKGDDLQIGYHFFPITPKRFLSLYTLQSLEDQFDYGEERPKLTYFKRIKKPLLIVMGSQDEFLDQSAEHIIKVYDENTCSKNYLSAIIPNAFHGFGGDEEKIVETIADWVTTI